MLAKITFKYLNYTGNIIFPIKPEMDIIYIAANLNNFIFFEENIIKNDFDYILAEDDYIDFRFINPKTEDSIEVLDATIKTFKTYIKKIEIIEEENYVE